MEPQKDKQPDSPEFGEGNYAASEAFQRKQHEFAKSGKVRSQARKAADALDGPEAEALEKARQAAARGDTE
jgi:hypothetical protein